MKCFLGLAADERAPDHSTLSLFRARLLKGEGSRAYEALVEVVVSALGGKEKGIVLGRVSASGEVDSVRQRCIANVNVFADNQRRRAGDRPRDPDARWGVKGSKGMSKG